MIGERYVGFIEATVFDTGYRRACSDLLGILERAVGQTVSVGNARVAIDQLIVYCKTPKDLSSGIRFFHVGVAIDGNPRRQVIWK